MNKTKHPQGDIEGVLEDRMAKETRTKTPVKQCAAADFPVQHPKGPRVLGLGFRV